MREKKKEHGKEREKERKKERTREREREREKFVRVHLRDSCLNGVQRFLTTRSWNPQGTCTGLDALRCMSDLMHTLMKKTLPKPKYRLQMQLGPRVLGVCVCVCVQNQFA